MIEQLLAVVRKDLIVERRGKASINALVFFTALVLAIFAFSLGPSPARIRVATAGLLWVAFVFAGVLAFARSYQTESENRCFEGSWLAGADPKALYLGKLVSSLLVMLAVEAVAIFFVVGLYGAQVWHPVALLIVGMLGTLGFAAVGTLYGALTMSMRAREVMLPVLLLPAVLPVILASVRATSLALVPGSHAGLSTWVELLVIFDVVFVTLGLLTFEFVLEE